MKVEVLYFARLREIFACDREWIELAEGATVAEAASALLKRPGGEALEGLPLLYAVNESYAKTSAILKDRDVLVLVPPISGG